jgi:hypothetical protein
MTNEMKQQALHVPAGKLFCLSEGEYSDYGYCGHFLALVELTPSMMREVEAEVKEQSTGRYEAQSKFTAALIRRGWVLDIDCVEIHTGSYGELSLS